jgi:hypothetical protein
MRVLPIWWIRYDIVDGRDLRTAASQLDAYFARELQSIGDREVEGTLSPQLAPARSFVH